MDITNEEFVSVEKVEKENEPIRYEADGLGGHGEEYQRLLAYYLIVEAMTHGCSFEMTFEMKAAGKFDDVGFLVRDKWYLFQSKHEQGNANKVTKEMLFDRKEGNYSLLKYYNGFKNMKWDYGEIENLILFTNKPIDELEFKQTSRCEIKLSGNYSLELNEGKHIRLVDKEKEMIEILEEGAFQNDSKLIHKALVKWFTNNEFDPILEKYKYFVKELLKVIKENEDEKIIFNIEHLNKLQSKRSKKYKEILLVALYQGLLKEFGDNRFENIHVSKQSMGQFWVFSAADSQDDEQFGRDFEKLSQYIYELFKNNAKIDSCIVKHRTILKAMFICDGQEVKFVKELDELSPLFELYTSLRKNITTEHFKSLFIPKAKMGDIFWTETKNEIISEKEHIVLKNFLSKVVLFAGQANVEGLTKIIISKLKYWMRTIVRPDDLGKMDNSFFEGLLNIVKKQFDHYEIKSVTEKVKISFGNKQANDLMEKIKEQVRIEVQKGGRGPDEVVKYYIYRKICGVNGQDTISEKHFVQQILTAYESQNCFIFTAQPGMGKTTLMQNLAFESQKTLPDNAVFLIYLNHFRNAMPEIKTLKDISDKNIFASELSAENVTLLVENSKKQIFIFFDAFDEMNETNKKRILTVIDVLRSKSNVKIVISGRNNVREQLEKYLNETSMELKPFDRDDQIDYFEKFWEIDAKDTKKIQKFSHKVLDKLKSDLSHQEQAFIGVPLMTWMVAEIFSSPVEQCINTNTALEKIIADEQFSICYLFDKFVKTSIKIMMNKKYHADKNFQPGSVFNATIEEIDYFYQVYAMRRWFDEKDCDDLCGTEDEWIAFVTNRKYHKTLHIFKSDFQQYQSLVLESYKNYPRFTHLLFLDYYAAKFLFEACGQANESFLGIFNDLSRYNNIFEFILAMVDSEISKYPLKQYIKTSTNNRLKWIRSIKKRVTLTSCRRDYLNIIKHLHFTYDASIFKNMKDYLGKPLLQITFENDSKKVDQYLVELFKQETNPKYSLHTIVESNRLDLVYHFLTETNINSVDDNGDIPLLLVKSVEMFDILIDNRANFQYVNSEEGENIFHKLITNATIGEFIKILLNVQNTGFQISDHINQYKKEGKTVLHKALTRMQYSQTFNAEIVKFLIETGIAVEICDLEVIRFLISAYASAYAKKNDTFNNTGIAYYLTKMNHISVWLHLNEIINEKNVICFIETCLQMGMDINAKYEGNAALNIVIGFGWLAATKLLVKKGANINTQNYTGETPLHKALWVSSNSMAEFIISQNIDLSLTDTWGNSVLHIAVQRRNRSCIEMLIKKYVESSHSLDEKTLDGKTALQIGFETGNESNVKILLKYGANVDLLDLNNLLMSLNKDHFEYIKYGEKKSILVHLLKKIDQPLLKDQVLNSQCNGQTALHIAAKYGFKKVVKIFVDARTNVNIKNCHGQIPLHLACNRKIYKLLVSYGADESIKYDNYENTGLHIAVTNGHTEMVKYFINKGSTDIDYKNKDGKTALHLAMEQNKAKIVKLLVNKQADINLKDNDGNSPLFYGLKYGYSFESFIIQIIERSDSNECVDLLFKYLNSDSCELIVCEALLEKITDINVRDENGRTFLHYVAINFRYNIDNQCNIINLFIRKGANVNAEDNLKNIPLHYACVNRYASCIVVGYLADFSSNINHKNCHGNTPLLSFLTDNSNRNCEILHLLIMKNASICLTDLKGNTPLHIAIRNRTKVFALMFIDLLDPLELNRQNYKGETALHVAVLKYRKSTMSNYFKKVELPQYKEETARHEAILEYRIPVIKKLVEKGANLHTKTKEGKTALELAREKRHKIIVDYLNYQIEASMSVEAESMPMTESESESKSESERTESDSE